MPREPLAYRDVLEGLLSFFDGKRRLTAVDVARHDGCDRRTAQKRYAIPKDGIEIYVLARRMCQ